jgi:hypothetical protein
VIGGSFVAPGALDPKNPCRACEPLIDTSDWSSLPAGTACLDGGVCIQSLCSISDAGCCDADLIGASLAGPNAVDCGTFLASWRDPPGYDGGFLPFYDCIQAAESAGEPFVLRTFYGCGDCQVGTVYVGTPAGQLLELFQEELFSLEPHNCPAAAPQTYLAGVAVTSCGAFSDTSDAGINPFGGPLACEGPGATIQLYCPLNPIP